MKTRCLILALLLGVLSLGSGFAIGLEAVDCRGKLLQLPSMALRVISLTPASTEILFAIGAGSQTVGLTEYCNYPAETKIKTKVGGFSGATVSTESIVALKPDLVLVSGDMHEKISALLEKLGIRVFAMEPRTFEDVYKNILAVGLLTGHSLEAALIVENMKTRLNAVSTRIAGRKPKAVFWELWDDPLMTAGGATFVNQAITAAGGKNIFADMSETWPTVSLEELLSRDADWILAGNDHGNRANFTLISKRTGWSKLTAVRMGQIATVESDKIFRGGPRLVEAVEEIERILR